MIYDELQEIKKFTYRATSDYRRIDALEHEGEKLEERVIKSENKISALWVTHGIALVVIGGLLLGLFERG